MGSAHGEVDLHMQDGIIMVKLSGSFNEEGAKQYTESVKNIVRGLKGNNFLMLINNLELEGGTPDAYQILESYNYWLIQHNLTAKAIVLSSDTLKDIIGNLSPSLEQQHCQYFTTIHDGMTWLKSHA